MHVRAQSGMGGGGVFGGFGDNNGGYAQAMQLITQLIGKDALVAAIRLLAKQSSEEAQGAS